MFRAYSKTEMSFLRPVLTPACVHYNHLIQNDGPVQYPVLISSPNPSFPSEQYVYFGTSIIESLSYLSFTEKSMGNLQSEIQLEGT